jgi:hypothetical protein
MGDVVNLNDYRKRLAKRRAGERASENRARHGLSRGQRRGAAADAERFKAGLDGNRLERKPHDRKAGAPDKRNDTDDAG